MKQAILLFSMLLSSYNAFPDTLAPDSSDVPDRRQALSIQIGTTGVGAFYTHILSSSHRLSVRVGGNYMAYRKPIRVKTARDSYITIDPDFVIGIAQANLKWHPFQKGAFFVTAGLGYTWHPNLSVVITAQNTLNLGGLELKPEDVGTVDLGFRWHPVVGYAGWGFGRTIPHKRIGVGFEMGVYYLGKPSVQLNYDGFLETTNIDEQVPIVEHNLSNYRYLPSINFTISYAFNHSR